MRIVKPLAVTSDQIVATNVPIDDAPAWAAGTYPAGTLTIYAEHVCEALTSTADRPDTGAAADPPTWLDRGAINRLRPFDQRIGNATTHIGPITYRLRLGEVIDAIAFLGVSADQLRVRALTPDDSTVTYDRTVVLTDYSPITDWYQYYFAKLDTEDSAILLDVTGFATTDLEITIGSDHDAPFAIGEILVGTTTYLGELLWGHSYGIQDFSKRVRDADFGDWTLVQRSYSDTARFPVEIATARERVVRRFLADIRATPALYIGADHRPGSVLYGVYEDFSVVVAGPLYSQCELTLSSML